MDRRRSIKLRRFFGAHLQSRVIFPGKTDNNNKNY